MNYPYMQIKIVAECLINTYSGSFRGKLTAECVMQLNVVDDKCLFGRQYRNDWREAFWSWRMGWWKQMKSFEICGQLNYGHTIHNNLGSVNRQMEWENQYRFEMKRPFLFHCNGMNLSPHNLTRNNRPVICTGETILPGYFSVRLLWILFCAWL